MSLAEFERAIESLQKYSEGSKKSISLGHSRFERAERAFKKAERVREKMLQEILKEKGLATCSLTYRHMSKDKKDLSLEDLGVFPRAKMRLYFHKSFPIERSDEYHDYTAGGDIEIHLLCPNCFPKEPNRIAFDDGLTKLDNGQVTSEIIQKGKKFILAVDGRDVTKIMKAGHQTGLILVSEFHPNGALLFLVDKAVYKHFEIPDLPEEPKGDF